MTLGVRLHLREWVLDLSAAVLVAGPPVFVAVPFLALRAALLMCLHFSASARVDVSKVERVGLGEVRQVELDDDPVRGVFEEGGATHPRVVHGVQTELHVTTLVRSLVLPALGTATGAPAYQEDSRKRHDAEEYRYPPHTTKGIIRAGMIHPPNGLRWCVLCRTSETSYSTHSGE